MPIIYNEKVITTIFCKLTVTTNSCSRRSNEIQIHEIIYTPDKNKISIRQAALIFLTIVYSPAIRFIPVYAAERAKQAAWLTPIISSILLFLIAMVWQRLYKKYGNFSLMYIYSDISGKFIGGILGIVHFAWITLLISLYLRYYSVRLVGSIYPHTNLSIFMVLMLILVIYVLRLGLVTLARLNEIVFPFLALTFFVLLIMLLTYLKKDFLTPITYRSIIPTINAGVGISGVTAYFSFLFIIGDYINNKEKIMKIGFQTSLFLVVSQVCLIVITVGTLSQSIIVRSQLPFLIAVKQISLFNTLEKIESVVVALWIASDFVLISFFVHLAMKLLKSLFKLADVKPLLAIYSVLIYYMSMYIANSVFEMEKLSSNLIIQGNIILGFILPALMLILAKVRKKI